MVAPKSSTVPSEVISDPTIMSGEPVVSGTRILAETIVSYLRAGSSAEESSAIIPAFRSTASRRSSAGPRHVAMTTPVTESS